MASYASGIIEKTRLRDWRVFVVTGWLCALAAAFGVFIDYSATAGPKGAPPNHWPTESLLTRGTGDTLLMFAHPKCPCTRASLRELAVLRSCSPGLEQIRVVFFQPSDAKGHWLETDIVRQAKELTGIEIVQDPEGTIAAHFGVETSGHVLLYDAADRLRFSGGITGLRNHEGWNAGSASVLAIERGNAVSFAEQPVFGCPIFDRAGQCCCKNCTVQP